jgi:hypothetical protein
MDAVADGREWCPGAARPAWRFAGAAVLVSVQVWLSFAASIDPVAFVLALAFVVALALSFASTVAGLGLTILFQIRILQSTEQIGLDEAAYALLFAATLAGWVLREGATAAGRRVLSSPVGRAILVFFGVCIASIVPTVVFGWSPLWWFRNLVAFATLLLFFPVAGTLTSRPRCLVVVGAALVVIIFHSVLAVSWYAGAIATAKAFWQLEWQRAPLHEVLPMSAVVAGLAGFLLSRSARGAAGWLLLALPGVGALAASQTRGYWLATAVAAGVLTALARGRRLRALWFALVVVALVAAVGTAALGGKFVGVALSMGERASTISSPLRSLSMQERMAETRALLSLISHSPLVGQGLGAEVSYTSPVTHRAFTTTYAHNAYLYLLYKLGVVGLAAFAAFYARALASVWRSLRSSGGQARVLLTAGFGLLVSFLPLSLTSPQYYDKSSVLIIALILGGAEAARR